MVLPKVVFDGIEDSLPTLAIEAVVVFMLNVYDELKTAFLAAARHGANQLDADASFDSSVLQIVQGQVCEQEYARLTKTPPIILDDLARENNLLSRRQLLEECRLAQATFHILKFLVWHSAAITNRLHGYDIFISL